MANNVSNNAKAATMVSRLKDYLDSAYKNNALPIGEDSRLSRTSIRKAIQCGQNWLNQNDSAKKLISEWDKKLHKEGVAKLPRTTPGARDPKAELLQAKVQRLERDNFELQAAKSEYERILVENGWLEDEQSSEQGRLPW